jgi:hypothetical protein
VGREERFLVLLEVSFVGGQHAVEPRQELVGTVVTMKNDRAIDRTVNYENEQPVQLDTNTPYSFATVRT